MNKPVLGLALGGILGAIDGFMAQFSAPEVAPQILQIVFFSTIKGLVVGVLVGWFAKKVHSVPAGVIVGLAIGAFFAFLVAMQPDPTTGKNYYWEIMLPGSVVGMIVGYATQRYGRSSVPARV
jgi:hypothetical protein